MEKKKLRCEMGCPVVVELIEATDPSACRFGYKVGDSKLDLTDDSVIIASRKWGCNDSVEKFQKIRKEIQW